MWHRNHTGPPPLTNWLVSIMVRDRSYGITAARTDLGYRPRVTSAAGLDGITHRTNVLSDHS